MVDLLLLLAACGLFDWFRGAGEDRIPKSLTYFPWFIPYGLCIGTLLHAENWWLLSAATALWWLGGKPAFTALITAVMRDSTIEQKVYLNRWLGLPPLPPVIALYVRGVLWGAPLLLLYRWAPSVIIFPWITGVAMLIPALVVPERRWATMEFTRGVLMGIAALVAYAFTAFYYLQAM